MLRKNRAATPDHVVECGNCQGPIKAIRIEQDGWVGVCIECGVIHERALP